MLLSKDQILSANDLEFRDVAVPEWGGTVRVAVMTGTARDLFERNMLAAKAAGLSALENFRAHLAAATIVDEQGNPQFAADDVEALGRKSSAALTRVFNVAIELNKLTAEDVQELAGE